MADHRAERAVLAPRDQELKEAFAALVSAFGGNEAVGEAIGRPHQRISEWRNAGLARFAPIDVVARLEACTVGLPGHPQVTRLLARRAGYELVDKVRVERVSSCDLMHGLAQLSAELGDVSRCLAEAMTDGEFTRAERRTVLEELSHVEQRAAALRALVEMEAC